MSVCVHACVRFEPQLVVIVLWQNESHFKIERSLMIRILVIYNYHASTTLLKCRGVCMIHTFLENKKDDLKIANCICQNEFYSVLFTVGNTI